MSVDPRLANLTLLVLAAKRCQAVRQTSAWENTVGLAALLATAQTLPRRSPWAMPSVMDGTEALTRMLEEARQWGKEGRHGA